MCGIAGFAGYGDEADLRRMTRALAHRGPDAEGLWCDPKRPVWLGHRRLSVVASRATAASLATLGAASRCW